ncbi:translation initiation factor IF-3, partial [Treponema endosymbiont of Eucomonympha sp.]|uniref:translation initiation factor IF-3 n=1 Tax=Treponema endosymbiont of Eucomonympha sp. TaxID=1580831 RepID=UPI000A3E2D7A
MADNRDLRINGQIRVREVRLIDDEGNAGGILSTQEAFNIARERQLDWVEVAPQAKPPVCKILDYGKYCFDLENKQQ